MGLEDIDYCLRAKKAEFSIYYNGDITAIHLEGFSSSDSTDKQNQDVRFYMNQVGYIYFAFNHFNYLQIIEALIIELLQAVFTIEGKDRVRKLKKS